MTERNSLERQLETLFSDIVVPDPDGARRQRAGRVAEVALQPPLPVSISVPRTIARPRPLEPSRRSQPNWVLISLALMALLVTLAFAIVGPESLAQQVQRNRLRPTKAIAIAQAATPGQSVTSLLTRTSTPTSVVTDLPETATPESYPTAISLPLTITVSIAGLPPTSEPPSPLSFDVAASQTATLEARPTIETEAVNSEAPHSPEPSATATQLDTIVTATPDATPALEPLPTATRVETIQITPTFVPSSTPVVVEQLEPTSTFVPALTPTAPQPAPAVPDRLVIPAINLDAPIITVGFINYAVNGQAATTWAVPEFYAAGWHHTSAPPGQPGNTVLNGHQLINGGVFRDLGTLQQGDEIIVYSGDITHHYRISGQHVVAEEGQPLSVRVENARWIMPTADERLTLVTCAPYGKSTHRLIVVAQPESPVTLEMP